MKLVIVESPTKSKTLTKFLGKNYKIDASMGHIRDLPKTKLGVDLENNFEPKYIILPKARKNVRSLKKEVKKADSVILATDKDREGEAIAWHLSQTLGLEDKSYQRIVFHEITKEAVQNALKNPREIDINLVNAQKARRILDRLVGYKLSPFLWKKVARGLSAGRVQSVAVKLIAEREKEIENFTPEEYWSIEAKLKPKKKKSFKAKLKKKNGKKIPKLGIKTKKETDKILKDLKLAKYKIKRVEKKETKKNPYPPFTTSTLQQTAWYRLNFPAKFTMSLAQRLYEKGFSTYHRTDSQNLSKLSLFAAKKFIVKSYGKKYWAGFFRKYKSKGKTQEAHEAIRPTYPKNTPERLKEKGAFKAKSKKSKKFGEAQFKLYNLIWRRFIASQMAQALFDSTKVDIKAKNYLLSTSGQTIKFNGFLKVYPKKIKQTELPSLQKNEKLDLIKLLPSQHFTQPPPRYTEATLIKELKKNDIGRPSTYAPILSTIQKRNYIQKNRKKKLFPTEIGTIVNNLLIKHFSKIVDVKFTAKMEKDLDKVAAGKKKWIKICKEFYEPFEKNLEKKYEEVSKKDITEEKTEKKCPKCGAPLVIKLGRYGKFYSCSRFPKCKYKAPIPKKKIGMKCPKCKKGEIVEKRTKKGKIFYGCNQFPKCDFALWDKPLIDPKTKTEKKCPKCQSPLVETKSGKTIKCSNKKCNYKRKKSEIKSHSK